MGRPLRTVAVVVIVLALIIAAIIWTRYASVQALEQRVEHAVVTTLQRESPEQFLVTGRLDVSATVQVTSTRIFLPDILGLELGSTTARVRAPGRVAYGFDVSEFTADDVRLIDGGEVEIVLPPLRVYSVDPQLDRLEIETRSGWFQPAEAEQRVTQEALARLRIGLERQGTAHLRDSVQPRANAARAMEAFLRPVLESAGLDSPRVRVIAGGEVVGPEG